jgi:hypothetical protein
MNWKNALSKLKLITSNTEEKCSKEPSPICVKPVEKGISDEEARHAAALDEQYFINQYAALACKVADQMFEKYGDSPDPQVQALLQSIHEKREKALRSLEKYNEFCAETLRPKAA